MSTILTYSASIAQGAFVTLQAWFVTGIVSIVCGVFLGIVSCRMLASKKISFFVRVYCFITKGVPAYVQILIAYFVIPSLVGINISAFVAACGALALCSSGYMTEIVRSTINAVPQGQWDACAVLGYSLIDTLRFIILPQAFKTALPALIGELEQLLKSSSLLATIGITELTRTGMNIISRELNPLPIYLTIAAIYLLFSAVLQLALLYAERKEAYGYR